MNRSSAQSLISVARSYYLARAPRERRMIVIMLGVVSLAIFWSWFQWQNKENARLDHELPQARARLANMQDASAEITRLRATAPMPQPTTAQILDSLQSSARTLQLNLNIRSIDNGLIQVSGSGVSFDTWVVWLAKAQSSYAARLSSADITQEAKGVRIEAQLSTLATR